MKIPCKLCSVPFSGNRADMLVGDIVYMNLVLCMNLVCRAVLVCRAASVRNECWFALDVKRPPWRRFYRAVMKTAFVSSVPHSVHLSADDVNIECGDKQKVNRSGGEHGPYRRVA